jgi:hypothetical protein
VRDEEYRFSLSDSERALLAQYPSEKVMKNKLHKDLIARNKKPTSIAQLSSRGLFLLRRSKLIRSVPLTIMVMLATQAAYADWNQFELAPLYSASSTGKIKAVSRKSNTMEVWWAGADGSLHDSYFYVGQGWNQFPLVPSDGSGNFPAAITAVSRESNTMEVFWIDSVSFLSGGSAGSVEDAYWYP